MLYIKRMYMYHCSEICQSVYVDNLMQSEEVMLYTFQ